MPRVKTRRGAKKRFKCTATGKIKFKHAYSSHNLATFKKSKVNKRKMTQTAYISTADKPKIRKMLAI